jgi:chlorophyll synthase
MQYPAPRAVLELLKPITWFAPMWAFACGIVTAPVSLAGHIPELVFGVLLAGPLVCATSQAVNDWYDRHVDAINEPNRPIPSGRIPGSWGFWIACFWTALSLVVAWALGPLVFYAAVFGILLAWAYSAPPFRLKRNGWFGNSAVAICYEGLPWFTGIVLLTGLMPPPPALIIAVLYSIGAHGIMTLNDFKSVEGDLKMGLDSLPAMLGVDRAARLACWVMALPQLGVIAILLTLGQNLVAGIVGLLLAGQLALMPRLLAAPRERASWYNGTGTTLYVLGMLAAAFALRSSVMMVHG